MTSNTPLQLYDSHFAAWDYGCVIRATPAFRSEDGRHHPDSRRSTEGCSNRKPFSSLGQVSDLPQPVWHEVWRPDGRLAKRRSDRAINQMLHYNCQC